VIESVGEAWAGGVFAREAAQHQRVAGPLSLRRVPPETFTVGARLEILTAAQHHAIQSTSSWSGILAQNEALVLLAALAYGSGPQYATFRDNDQHRYAEAALKRAGILYSDHGPPRRGQRRRPL
jgi:hypothetical protein